MYVAITGRLPALSVAELEAMYSSEAINPFSREAVLVEAEAIDFKRLGGTIKLGTVIDTLGTAEWGLIKQHLSVMLPELIATRPPGKLTIGASVYGEGLTKPKELQATLLGLKKLFKNELNRSVRIVPAKTLQANSAQVIHNQLTGPRGLELLIISNGRKTLLATTEYVQDIDDYAQRDHGRPKRDAKVGMLPPKLAQTMINLANPPENATILDPFCGTGVVLQESLLMGYRAYGSDLEPRMVEYSARNLAWLSEHYNLSTQPALETADATKQKWNLASVDTVVSETYLGPPLSKPPAPAKLKVLAKELDNLHRTFLKNLHKQLPKEARLCLAVPVWLHKRGNTHLPFVDQLPQLGYNRVSFAYAGDEELVYSRSRQIVGRELLVLTRK